MDKNELKNLILKSNELYFEDGIEDKVEFVRDIIESGVWNSLNIGNRDENKLIHSVEDLKFILKSCDIYFGYGELMENMKSVIGEKGKESVLSLYYDFKENQDIRGWYERVIDIKNVKYDIYSKKEGKRFYKDLLVDKVRSYIRDEYVKLFKPEEPLIEIDNNNFRFFKGFSRWRTINTNRDLYLYISSEYNEPIKYYGLYLKDREIDEMRKEVEWDNSELSNILFLSGYRGKEDLLFENLYEAEVMDEVLRDVLGDVD